MAFIDSKNETINFILTQHGRKLLGEGNFAIAYYGFGDDEIDYQSTSGISSGSIQDEIEDRWLVFEPMSAKDIAVEEHIFSMPIGQKIAPEFLIFSASIETSTGSVQIEKVRYNFDDENDAIAFINEIGEEYISSQVKTETVQPSGKRDVNVQFDVINYPKLNFSFDFRDMSVEKGFLVEVFQSASVPGTSNYALFPVTHKAVYDELTGGLISEPYTKFFTIIPDTEED